MTDPNLRDTRPDADSGQESDGDEPASGHRDPAAPPPGGVDWRVFVGVAIALLGFALVIVVAILG